MHAIRIRNENGFVLITAMIFLVIIGLIGSTAVMVTTTDIKIGANFKDSRQAFYDAEAGVQYALGRVETDLKAGSIGLPASVGDSIPLDSYSAAGFSFTFTDLTKSASNRYTFISSATGPRNSRASIEAVLARDPAINFAAFGDVITSFHNSSNVYSYDSGTTPDPDSDDSTGEGDLGSNNEVETKSGVFIDGDGMLGEDESGEDATLDNGGTFTGTTGEQIGRVDPDPLGVVGGEYADKFTAYSTSNDNSLALPAIISGEITLGNSEVIVLNGKSGGANYYLSSINIGNSAQIRVDTSAGPVNIYLTGGLETGNDSEITVINNGKPTDFSIFSNSTAAINIRNSGDFVGMIYAPYANIEFKNSTTIYGAVWGKEVHFKATATLYYDTALKDKYQSKDLSLVSWKDARSG
jgi:hypothetical protein